MYLLELFSKHQQFMCFINRIYSSNSWASCQLQSDIPVDITPLQWAAPVVLVSILLRRESQGNYYLTIHYKPRPSHARLHLRLDAATIDPRIPSIAATRLDEIRLELSCSRNDVKRCALKRVKRIAGTRNPRNFVNSCDHTVIRFVGIASILLTNVGYDDWLFNVFQVGLLLLVYYLLSTLVGRSCWRSKTILWKSRV